MAFPQSKAKAPAQTKAEALVAAAALKRGREELQTTKAALKMLSVAGAASADHASTLATRDSVPWTFTRRCLQEIAGARANGFGAMLLVDPVFEARLDAYPADVSARQGYLELIEMCAHQAAGKRAAKMVPPLDVPAAAAGRDAQATLAFLARVAALAVGDVDHLRCAQRALENK